MSLHETLLNAMVKVQCCFFGLIYFVVPPNVKLIFFLNTCVHFVFALSLLMHIFKQPFKSFLFDAYAKAAAEFSTDFETPCHIIMTMILRTSCG